MKNTAIKSYINSLNISRKDMQEYLGISQSALSLKVNGKSEFSISEIEKLAKLSKKSTLEIFANLTGKKAEYENLLERNNQAFLQKEFLNLVKKTTKDATLDALSKVFNFDEV